MDLCYFVQVKEIDAFSLPKYNSSELVMCTQHF